MTLERGCSLRRIRVRIELVPLEELARPQYGVGAHVEIEVLLDLGRRNVAIESRHLADELDLLGAELLVASAARLVVYRLGLDVLLEEGAYGLARHLDVVLERESDGDLLDATALLEAQIEYAILGEC